MQRIDCMSAEALCSQPAVAHRGQCSEGGGIGESLITPCNCLLWHIINKVDLSNPRQTITSSIVDAEFAAGAHKRRRSRSGSRLGELVGVRGSAGGRREREGRRRRGGGGEGLHQRTPCRDKNVSGIDDPSGKKITKTIHRFINTPSSHRRSTIFN